MNPVLPPTSEAAGSFPFHSLGYLRHWLVTAPSERPYAGPPGAEDALRSEALDPQRIEPPREAALHEPGPGGQPWRLYYPGENFFVEHSSFFFRPTIIDCYAFTMVDAAQAGAREVRFWVAGAADLWVNGVHITRFDVTRYMYPASQRVTLPLRCGINTLCVRLQCFGVRDTRILFGLQFFDIAGLMVRIPGTSHLADAARWLDGVRTEGNHTMVSSIPAPSQVEVVPPGAPALAWPAGSSRLCLGSRRPFQVSVQVTAEGQTLQRPLEIPANRAKPRSEISSDRRTAYLEDIAASINATALPLKGNQCHLPLLARRLLGLTSEMDEAILPLITGFIERREDCADFAMATLLRLESLGLASAAESAEIRRVALAFRYWSDEPGNDAMCFWSENHSLLFHGCQLIAGRLYPDAVFSNSQRTGREQATLGATRCREWLDRIEPRGFEEFNSSTYLPITVGALLNIVDFSGDADMARRASALMDRAYEDLASHAFDGVVSTPQGRVYRNVLYPEESGNQALLSYATMKAQPHLPGCTEGSPRFGLAGDWIVYPCSSPNYRPPGHLGTLTRKPCSRRYQQAGVEIVLHKTDACLLTSLAIPSLASEQQGKPGHLQPGDAGYQQHIWQATLGSECHVFVNHPGCSFDDEKSRPGYWFGNGVLPRVVQREGVLQTIFNIPDGAEGSSPITPASRAGDLHPIPFTHAHWPSDAFDREEFRGHWIFGQKNAGCIGLWCSEPLKPHHDVLTAREFRAWAHRSAWVVVCGSLAEHESFEAFIESCLARQPEFDRAALALQMRGEATLFWTPQTK